MTLTSTYDHRVIQGAQSGEYLRRVDELLGGADRFYDGVFASFDLTPAALLELPRASATRPSETGTGARTRTPRSTPRISCARSPPAWRSFHRIARTVTSAATLDPSGSEPVGDPALDSRTYGLTPPMMAAVPASVLRVTLPGGSLAEVLPRLRETYSSTIAFEVEHISNLAEREWLRGAIESGTYRTQPSPEFAKRVLKALTNVETFERYLRRTYVGYKTFSIEGLDVMVPMLEALVAQLAHEGTGTAVIGMAHRGRLATIAHVVSRPYEELLAEFEAADTGVEGDDVTGDVKYHHGSQGTYVAQSGDEITVILANNPSHLEAVDGVVEGRTRALQTDHTTAIATLDSGRAAPILIHGDAAFSAQGVVAEVLNLQALAGYRTGGTLHIIANNQIGFTTDPADGRSTRYASDLAKGFDVPIIHVNADDVDACLSAVRLALDFRRQFEHDVIIDLIGYRRFGHNETDEPAYTQPRMYDRIKSHPTVRELYAQKLIAQGIVGADEANAMTAATTARIAEAHAAVKGNARSDLAGPTRRAALPANGQEPIATSVARSKLLAWNDELIAVPDGFVLHPKLVRQLERRKAAMQSDGEVDWGLAEALAFASLLEEISRFA